MRVMAGLLLLVMVGCSAGQSGDTGPNEGSAPSEVKVGVVLPFTGVYAQLGQDIWDGMNLYLDSIGSEVEGTKIVLIKEDEEAAADVAVRKTRKLIEQDKVDVLAGYVSSASATAIRDIIHETKTPVLLSNAGSNALTRERKSPYLFRLCHSNWMVGAHAGQYAAEHMGKKAVTFAADYEAGKQYTQGFVEMFEKGGGQVVKQIYAPLGTTDYAPFLAQIKAEQPDLLFTFFAGSDAIRFVKQWAEYGLKDQIPVISGGHMVDEDTLPQQGDAAVGILSSLYWAYSLDTPENRAFVQAFEEKYNRVPSSFAAQGYDTMMLLVEGLRQTGGDASDKDKLVAAMKDVTFVGPRGPVSFNEGQSAILTFIIREVEWQGDHLTHKVIATTPGWADKGE